MSNIVALSSIKKIDAATREAAKAALAEHQGCSSGSCGSDETQNDMPAHIWEKIKDHPCYSEEAHHHFARMHVAVAPACNIQCNYCNRKYDCSNESRPGVVSERLTPDQAMAKVLAVAAEVPQLSVVGIAGPGDALADAPKTFKTFELLAQTAPDIKLCLSTNGLALPDWVETIKQYNVDHVTITINAVDPEVGAKIYPWVYYNHKRYRGVEAAKILLERQMQGLEMLTEAGILVKVNSVLIPGINDEHLAEVNKAVKARGAFLHNIMPLISEPEHGTYFGLNGQRGPTAQELKDVQDQCSEGGAKLMRHCRQCRADAVGLLGEDRASEFTVDKVLAKLDALQSDGAEARAAYRELVDSERSSRQASREAVRAELVDVAADLKVLVAVATKGGGRINEHFGHVNEFQIYQVSAAGAEFIGHRRVDHYCQGGYGEEERLPTIIKALGDCAAVLVAKIGACPRNDLAAAGLEAIDSYPYEDIKTSLLSYFQGYVQRVQAGEVQPNQRHDAQIRQGAYVA